MKEIDVQCSLLDNGLMVCWGRKKMCPESGDHTRGAAFYTPMRFAGDDKSLLPPVVTATIFGRDSVGTAFVVYNIKVKAEGAKTLIAVHAQNMELGCPSKLAFWCNLVAIGKPYAAPGKARRKQSSPAPKKARSKR